MLEVVQQVKHWTRFSKLIIKNEGKVANEAHYPFGDSFLASLFLSSQTGKLGTESRQADSRGFQGQLLDQLMYS